MRYDFGDDQQECSVGALAQALCARLWTCETRALLIALGQLEQLAYDVMPIPPAAIMAATDHAANALCVPERRRDELTEVSRLLSSLTQENARGQLKTPEGFAFYALYPEQYGKAARRWLLRHSPPPRHVHVVGLRSIGTTLSAIVAAVLRAAGVAVSRLTVRPTGHPFAREVHLQLRNDAAAKVIVVDEGPGLSGTSLFAAARAVPMPLAIITGHHHPPGAMADDNVRRFFGEVERYSAGDEDVSRDPLKQAAERMMQQPVRELRPWTQAHAHFQRPKYRATLGDGGFVLLKFFGQVWRRGEFTDAAAEAAIARCGQPVCRCDGFVMRPWIDGQPLTPEDKDIAMLARYLGHLASCDGRMAPAEWLRLSDGSVCKLPPTLPGYDHSEAKREGREWDLAATIVEWRLNTHEVDELLSLYHRESGAHIVASDLAPYVKSYADART